MAGAAAASTSTPPPTGRWPGRWPSGRSCCSTPAPRCRCSARAGRRCAGWPWSGPCADDPRTFMGCYAFPNHVLPRYPGLGLGIEVPTARRRAAGRAARTSRSSTSRAARCRARTGPASPRRVAAARGRRPVRRLRRRPRRPVRPGHVRRGLRRRGPAAARACRPTCSTSCSRPGRPWSSSSSPAARTRSATCTAGPPALVQAFMPGEEGGAAIAGVLSGPGAAGRQAARADPAASRRPAGHLPPAAARRPRAPASAPSTRPRCSRSGYGASYTTFEVDDLRHQRRPRCRTDGEFTVSVRVRNTGARAGDEVVQLYLHDVVAQVTRPVRQLAGFARVQPGAGRGGRRARSACTPTGPRSPTATCSASSSPATSRSWSAPRRPTCPAAARSGSTGPGACRRARPPARHPRGRSPGRGDGQPVRAGGGPCRGDVRRTAGATLATRGGVRGRLRRDRLQGAQRPQRRRPGDPRAGPGAAARSTTTSAPARRSRPPERQPTVELVFHGELNAYCDRDHRRASLDAAAERRRRRRGEPAPARAAGTRRGRPAGVGARAGRRRPAGRRSPSINELTAGDLAALSRARLPLVVIDPLNLPQARVTSVGSTNFAGGLAATQHLLALGHRRIAYVGGPARRGLQPGPDARLPGRDGGRGRAGPGRRTSATGRFHYEDGVGSGRRAARPARAARPPCSPPATRPRPGVIEAARAPGPAGPRGPQRRRLRRHPGRPVRARRR